MHALVALHHSQRSVVWRDIMSLMVSGHCVSCQWWIDKQVAVSILAQHLHQMARERFDTFSECWPFRDAGWVAALPWRWDEEECESEVTAVHSQLFFSTIQHTGTKLKWQHVTTLKETETWRVNYTLISLRNKVVMINVSVQHQFLCSYRSSFIKSMMKTDSCLDQQRIQLFILDE